MMIWLMLGIMLGALLVVGCFAMDWFEVRSMIERDIREAMKDADVWDAFQRRREDDWFSRPVDEDPEIDVWDVFSAPPATGPAEQDDVWDAFSEPTRDEVPEFLRGEDGDSA